MGKTATKAKNKYNSLNYERIVLSVKKGKKDIYQQEAEKHAMSLTAYILYLIEKDIENGEI